MAPNGQTLNISDGENYRAYIYIYIYLPYTEQRPQRSFWSTDSSFAESAKISLGLLL